MYDIGSMLQHLIASIHVHQAQQQALQVEVQDVTRAKSIQSKARYSSVTPENMGERWQLGLV
jgi:hypothetical protein